MLSRISLLRLGSCHQVTTKLTITPTLNSVRTYAGKKGYVYDTDLSYDDFNKKYKLFFDKAEDLFEVQRGLNNCFSHDLVPSTEVCEAAIKACRRVSDYPTAVRVLQGLKHKCPTPTHYQQYLQALSPLCTELGIEPYEELKLE